MKYEVCTPEDEYRKYRLAEEMQKSCAEALIEERAVNVNLQEQVKEYNPNEKWVYAVIGASLAVIANGVLNK